MHILTNRWQDGYLDYYRPKNYVRIQVKAWWVAQYIRDMFIEQPRDWRRVWNYLGKYGPHMVIKKVLARYGERFRDIKVLALGIGTVIESDFADSHTKGQKVVFIAPCHPQCVERIALPCELTAPIDTDVFDRVTTDKGIIYLCQEVDEKRYDELTGWTQYSGWKLPEVMPLLLRDASDRWRTLDTSKANIMGLAKPSAVQEQTQVETADSSRLKAVLFGFGNQAKTIVIPNLGSGIEVTCVHEIDPIALGKTASHGWKVDSSPVPRLDQQYDVYLIAGYHDSHASLAAHALKSGAWAVVEKPLVTTWEELRCLMNGLEQNPSRYFAGFHMRYSPLWKLAIEDLGLEPGEPIHYHCQVFEVPVPRRNWYNWPNAHSRIVSNGCHWIDHFLYMNHHIPS